MDKYKGAQIGIVIECEGGHVTVPNYTSATAYDKDGKEIKNSTAPRAITTTSSRPSAAAKWQDLNADILEGHLSSALCHTGNISYRLGTKKPPARSRRRSRPRRRAEAFGRMVEHLAPTAWTAKEQLTLGVPLKMDPKTERFIGNDKANELLTRPYRAGFVVPEKA